MAVPRGPTVNEPTSLVNIQDEFGGSNPISLNEYYAGGSYVAGTPPTSGYQTSGIPASGAISIGNFLGLTKDFVFTDTISSNRSVNYDLATQARAAGWNGSVPLVATVTINGGVSVVSHTSNTVAFTVGSLPAGSTVAIYNYGYIIGHGGWGGNGGQISANGTLSGGSNGGDGGTALWVGNPNTRIWNFGVIGGGGGGGGGGGATTFTSGKSTYASAGGGGGGGAGNGTGGSGGSSAFAGGTTYFGTGGGWGGPTYPGAGGAGGSSAGSGANGGDIGQPGYPGYPSGGPATAGGSPGWAVSGGGNIIWHYTGTLLGYVDGWGTYGGAGVNHLWRIADIHSPVVATRGLYNNWSGSMGGTWYYTQMNGTSNWPFGGYTYHAVYTNTGGPITAHCYGLADDAFWGITVNGEQVAWSVDPALFNVQQSPSFTLQTGLNHISITIANTVNNGPTAAAVQVRNSSTAVLVDMRDWHF